MANLIPLHEDIIFQTEENEKITKGGVYIPDTIDEKPRVGIVVAIGPEVQKIQVGDRILVAPKSHHDVKFEDKLYRYMKYKEIICILK